ncbi:MAG: PP2C family protein-serine/threonine phosphatase [Candidatus Acidulodesulfobacterium sp.]
MHRQNLEEKIYSAGSETQFLKEGDIINAAGVDLRIEGPFIQGWYSAKINAGESVFYYSGNCGLWKGINKCDAMPEILLCTDDEIIILNDKKYIKYEYKIPSSKKENELIIKYISDLAEIIKNLTEQGMSLLYINPDSLYIYGDKIKLNILPDLSEIGKKMFSPRDLVAPEVLMHDIANGKEGVYLLGLFAYKFLTGNNINTYDIDISNYIKNIKIPGFPQFLYKTLSRSEERFDINEAIGYLKNIKEERKTAVRFDIGISSTVGLNPDRLIDEDACGYAIENNVNFSEKNLVLKACLADGMGGMAAGEYASRAAVKGFFKSSEYTEDFSKDINDIVTDLAWQANKSVFDELQGKDGGCTFIGIIFKNETFALAHVGDSRAYLWINSKSEDKLKRLTKDHSYVALMVSSGNMTEEEAKISPDRNKILKSLGIVRNRQSEYFDDLQKTIGKKTEDLNIGDIILIVCDGIWSELEETDIIKILSNSSSGGINKFDAQYVADALISSAIEKGAQDNATALVIKRVA